MLYYFLCQDKPDHGAVRAANRAAHLAYLDGFHDQVKLAGPRLDESGQNPIGSLLVVDLPDAVAAAAFCQNDPYNKAGLFADVIWGPFRQVLPV